MPKVSFYIDDFIRDKTIWFVILSDGMTIFQDDGRPGLEQACAWIRLQEYLRENPGLKINKFGIKFRSHTEFLPDNCDGYYFSNGILKAMQSEESREYKILGYIEDRQIICRWYAVPELVIINTTVKPLKDSINLISNNVRTE